jgi:predicted transcriptional regulator of viral defense system
MGTLDAPLRAVAKSLIGEFGTAGTITRVTPGRYNIQAGTQAETTANTTVSGVVSAFKHYELGAEIRATDRKYLVAASDVTFVPDVDDRVTIGSDTYRIVRTREVQATDQAAVYELALRAA